MPGRVQDIAEELFAEERVREIDWSHPALSSMSDPARLIYASLVDGCSSEARETIAGVDVVWRNRHAYESSATTSVDRRGILDTICRAVEELIARGLLVLLDDSTIGGGWVRKPWEGLPS